LRAATHGATTDAEREALEAVYAYERTLYEKHGRRVRASRTWKMIEEHGIIHAIERLVTCRKETMGYMAVVEMGMRDMTFEAVVLRHPEVFSVEAAQASTERLEGLRGGQ
jgi:hypothetical protein